MKKLGAFLILTLAWAVPAQASPFSISRKVSPKFEKELLQAYQFVAARIPDPVDRNICPIKVSFKDLKNSFGRTISKNDQSHCDDEIILDKSLKENWQAQSVFVHELTHLFRYAHNPEETLWLDEGAAKVMESLYIGIWQSQWEEEFKKLSSLKLSDDPKDYLADGSGNVVSYFLMQYLFDHLGGIGFLSEVVSSPLTGWDNIESVAQKMRAQNVINIPAEYLSGASLWLHFGFAAVLDDPFRVLYKLFSMGGRYQKPELDQFPKFELQKGLSASNGVSSGQVRYWYLSDSSMGQSILAEIEKNGSDKWYVVEVNAGWRERLIQKVDQSSIGSISFQRYPLVLIQSTIH